MILEKNTERDIMNNKDFALLAARTLDRKKAADIVVIDIMEKASFADYMVIASGNSSRQVQSLVDEIEDQFAKEGLLVKSIEGKQNSDWVLMDFGDVIVNVFTRETREKYNIEKVWGDCSFLDWEEESGNE
jgi:ribosome-associated protein